VAAVERDQHLRRVIWRGGDEKRRPDIYVSTTVNFGDKPAGCVAQTAVRETAKLYRHLDSAAADLIINSTFCDDTLGGGDSKEEARRISENMDKIVAMGGFLYKETVMSGDQQPEGDSERKVLGIGWEVEKDLLYIDFKINITEKKKGVRAEPDWDLQGVRSLEGVNITKRVVWRVVLGQYDLLGLACVYTIQLKLIMRELSGEAGNKMGWDDTIPSSIKTRFIEVVEKMDGVRKIRFPRCVRPPGAAAARPQLLCFADGSTLAFCALAYARWEMEDGSFNCRLIAGKARVAPQENFCAQDRAVGRPGGGAAGARRGEVLWHPV